MADLCDHKGILTKLEKYQLPVSEHFRYSQKAYFLSTLSQKSDLVSMSSMDYFCHKYDKIRVHISEVLVILNYTSAKLGYMAKWEQDFNETLELDEWHSLAREASRSLINPSIIEANYEVLLRWYRLGWQPMSRGCLCYSSEAVVRKGQLSIYGGMI